MNYRRLIVGLITGAILGVFCIVGAYARFHQSLSTIYLLSFWFNRVLIGLVIGLLPLLSKHTHMVLRGIVIGFLISFAFYSATDFLDTTGFFAGAVYGIIIEYTTKYFGKS